MDEGHRAQRVVDPVTTVGEGILDRQYEARRELSERTTRVHESGRIRLEATLHHQAVEILRHAGDFAVARAVTAVRFSNRSRYPPEHVFRLLPRYARRVLDQVSFADHGASVVVQLGFPFGGDGRYGHLVHSLPNKKVVK